MRRRTRYLVLAAWAVGFATVALSACASDLGDRFDDAAIVTRVKTALLNDLEVGRWGIDVSSNRGFVQLSGQVPTALDIERAVRIARDVTGVLSVTSHIQIQISP